MINDTTVRPGEFLLSEGNGTISRDEIIISSAAGALAAGTVLAAVTDDGAATVTAQSGNTGDGALPTVTVADTAKPGRYTLTIVSEAGNAGGFNVVGPDGDIVGVGTVGVAFDEGGLSFTLADGANDYDANDRLFIDVAFDVTKYIAYTAGAVAAGVLYAGVPDSDADQDGVIVNREAEVIAAKLTGLDAAARLHLAARGFKFR